jgi:hypothetical protein
VFKPNQALKSGVSSYLNTIKCLIAELGDGQASSHYKIGG